MITSMITSMMISMMISMMTGGMMGMMGMGMSGMMGMVSAETAVFGDSILASNTPIVGDLETWSGVRIRNHATIGAGYQPGWVESIPQEYERHRDPIPSTVILDGGGNDINSIRNECLAFSMVCVDTIDRVIGIIKELMSKMRTDGVQSILYSGFYHIPGFDKTIDYAVLRLQEVCRPEDACYFVDLRNVTVHLGWDGMHPVTESYHDIAKRIWETATNYNITFT